MSYITNSSGFGDSVAVCGPREGQGINHNYIMNDCVCPWCGYKLWDTSDMTNSTELTCSGCEREYSVERDIVFFYTTKRMGEEAA